MQSLDDMSLLREYAANNSEAAFAELVSRRVGFVYAAALRQVRDPHLAEEITQAVFIILAQKAGKISGQTILAGWLFKTTRYAAIAQTREIIKRRQRELEVQMQSVIQQTALDETWEQMSPLLDEALASLGETDRQAVLLRFFENKSLAEVGRHLGTGEDTARKRVTRALEKLHRFFNRRGVSSTTTILAGAMSANSVSAAPVALAKSVTAVAIAKGAAASGSTLTLIKGALKIMAWTKMKTIIVVGATILAAGTATTVVVEKIARPKLSSTDLSWADDPKYWEVNSAVLDKLPPVFIFRPTKLPWGGSTMFGSSITHQYKCLARKCDVKWLVTVAYDGYSEQRCVFPPDMPNESYDYMFTLPGDYHAKLKAELNSRFGLTAHVETRTVVVWLLQVKTPDAPGLKPSDGKRNDWIGGQYEAKIHGHQISNLIGWLEGNFGRPIIDRTGLTERFDLDLKWKPGLGQSENDALQQMLLNNLGLELVPSREPIEMLVVEKVK
jgi:uncharacterized protein (TIGR03435 family)